MVVEQAARDHCLGAAHDLLGGLKDEQVAPADIPDSVHQRARDADHDPHVRVVPAGVHTAIGARFEVDARFLFDRKGVDVRPKHHGLARLACVEHRHDTCLGRARLELEAQLLQTIGQVGAGLVLAEAHLRVTVEVASQLDHLFDHGAAGERGGAGLVAH